MCRPRVDGLAIVATEGRVCCYSNRIYRGRAGMHCLLHKVMMLEFMYTHRAYSKQAGNT